MTWPKRMLDLALALTGLVLLLPVIIAVAITVLARDGRPVFYRSERMRSPDASFGLWKFRTMTTGSDDGRASGGSKSARITPTGQWLRRYRLDELPQLWNILRGDMSFVGPRPPLRRYVELFPELYATVLTVRPGMTGLATLLYHRREAELLSDCRTAEETEEIYCRHCVPAKARLDRAYIARRTACYDIWLLWRTVCHVVGADRG